MRLPPHPNHYPTSASIITTPHCNEDCHYTYVDPIALVCLAHTSASTLKTMGVEPESEVALFNKGVPVYNTMAEQGNGLRSPFEDLYDMAPLSAWGQELRGRWKAFVGKRVTKAEKAAKQLATLPKLAKMEVKNEDASRPSLCDGFCVFVSKDGIRPPVCLDHAVPVEGRGRR